MPDSEQLEAQQLALIALNRYAKFARERDDLIRAAHRAGVTYVEIARILGMGRGTVTAIANKKPGRPHPASQGSAARPAPKG